jgi:hypothetical protein
MLAWKELLNQKETKTHIMQGPHKIIQILVVYPQLAAQVVLQRDGESVCQNELVLRKRNGRGLKRQGD